MEKNEILKELVINEEEEFKKIVEKAKKIIKIKSNGEPVILVPKDKIKDAEYIACYLLGMYFSKKLGLVQSATATNVEIAKKTGIDKKIVGARLTDLRRDNIVESPSRGSNKILFVGIEKFLDTIVSKIEKEIE